MLDRVKESLFSVLEGYGRIRGRVLDLYAGTGSIGIEFLSRGASAADFVEQSAGVCAIIRDNLKHTKLDAFGRVHTMSVERFLLGNRGSGAYDYIMMDPPYADPAIERMIALVQQTGVGHDGSLLVVGHSPKVTLADSYPGLFRIKFRRLGDSCFSIYEHGDAPPEGGVDRDESDEAPDAADE
jgi:16S rRNA (guanine(966)-N(2))-methyltransferase RsmD